MAIALVETTTSSINYSKYFKFEFDRYALCSDSSKRKILKEMSISKSMKMRTITSFLWGQTLLNSLQKRHQ